MGWLRWLTGTSAGRYHKERGLFYVALTRSKEAAVLTYTPGPPYLTSGIAYISSPPRLRMGHSITCRNRDLASGNNRHISMWRLTPARLVQFGHYTPKRFGESVRRTPIARRAPDPWPTSARYARFRCFLAGHDIAAKPARLPIDIRIRRRLRCCEPVRCRRDAARQGR